MAMRSEVTGNVLMAPVLKKVDVRSEDKSEERTICELRIMSAEYRNVGQGRLEQIDSQTFPVQITIWHESTARRIYEHIKVGASITAIGSFYCRPWKDQNGNPQVEGRMNAERVALNLSRVESVKFRERTPADTAETSAGTPAGVPF